ncbi:MAG: VOC family protein [Saprospiraceae bacterium]|nr:VOC family protein [Saprospiraceae bacterium]
MSFEHLGEVKEGKEDFEAAQTRGWAGAKENYTLTEKDGGVLLEVDLDADDAFEGYFSNKFPQALAKVKELAEVQTITPFLWFDNQAEAAARLYASVFPNSKIQQVIRNGDAVLTVSFSLSGQQFTAMNGGPQFKLTPAISLFAVCETEAETDAVWKALSEGGEVLMPLDKYPWSEKYGFLNDRYGLSWQIYLGKLADVRQRFSPSFLFTGARQGRAEEAIHFYTSLFSNSSIRSILKNGAGESDPEGTVKHAEFYLNGQQFMAMDSAAPHAFQFNEAFSFVIHCDTQEKIDYYWNALTADGGEESQCGWLKDKFGVSWQVVPPVLMELLGSPDAVKSQRAMQAMMQMKKLDIAALKAAFEGAE